MTNEFLIGTDDLEKTTDNCEKIMDILDKAGIDAWFCETKENGNYR